MIIQYNLLIWIMACLFKLIQISILCKLESTICISQSNLIKSFSIQLSWQIDMKNKIKISEGMLRCNESCENWDVGTLFEFNFQSFVDLGSKFGVVDQEAKDIGVVIIEASDLNRNLGCCQHCKFKEADQLLILVQCCVFRIYQDNHRSEYLVEVAPFSLNNVPFT